MRKKLLAACIIILSSLFIQACGRKLKPQESCNFVQNSESQRVSWKGNLPIRIDIHSSVPSEHYSAIEGAVDEWNRTLGREAIRINQWGVSGSNTPERDGVSTIYWLSQWEANRPTEQARTTIYWSGARIYEADIRINASGRFTFYTGSGDDNFSGVDLYSLMVHEIGHVLGLAHIKDSKSVMATSLPSGYLRREVSKSDMDSMHCEY